MIRVQIVQPAVPAYRVPLFQELMKCPGLSIRIYASRISPEGVRSVEAFHRNVDVSLHLTKFPFVRLYWQWPLRLDPDLAQGDVVVVSGNPRLLSNIKLIAAAKSRGVAVLWWGHGWTAGANPLTASIRRRMMRCMDAWLLYTDRELEEYASRGFDRDRLFALNNTIDHRPIRAAISRWNDRKLKSFRQNQGIENTHVLLFCGRITKKASLGIALEAFEELRNRYAQDVTFVVIGDGPEKEHLMIYANELGLGQKVRWLGALYDEEDLAPWFLSATCLVYPGAIGLSLLHSFAYGVPVITHDNAQNQMPEFAALAPGRNGLVYAEGNSEDLSRAIASMIENSSLRARMAEEARRTLYEDYPLDASVKRFADAICAASRAREGVRNR